MIIAIVSFALLCLLSAALASAGIMQVSGRQLTRQTSLPFGPFLAVGLLVALAVQLQSP